MKIISLHKGKEFSEVYTKGESKANRYLVMYVLNNGLSYNRIGISVSKKVGNSVVRHRIRRLIRESLRLCGDRFNIGLDLVVIARGTAKGRTYQEIADEIGGSIKSVDNALQRSKRKMRRHIMAKQDITVEMFRNYLVVQQLLLMTEREDSHEDELVALNLQDILLQISA